MVVMLILKELVTYILYLYFFFWPLCCLFFFDLLILINPLVSSNSFCNHTHSDVKVIVISNTNQYSHGGRSYRRPKIEHVKPFVFCGIFDYISFRAFKYVWYSLYFHRHLLLFMETVAILKVL
jgi:hypothetical protein